MSSDESIYEYLTRLSRLLQAEERESETMVPVQLQALLYLARCNRYSDSPSAVAEYLGITKGTASQTIGALERGGFVRKKNDASDGRGVRLSLTGKGRRVAAARAIPTVLADGLDSMRGKDVETLRAGLDALLRSIQRAGHGRTFGVCHSCRHFTRPRNSTTAHCGLTGEALSTADRELICREHEPT